MKKNNYFTFCLYLLTTIFFQTNLFSQDCGWILKNPYPQAFDLNSSGLVPGTNSFFAVGKVGSIILTSDEGASWQNISAGITFNLNDIAFPSNTIGFIIGDSGTVLKSIDGGNIWNAINVSSSLNLSSTYFINPDTGFILGSKEVMKTVNGGISWTTMTFNFNVRSIIFSSDSIGFIAADSGRVVKTIDCGTSWTILNTGNPQNLYSIFFLDDTMGFIGGSNYKILKTIDGGLTWALIGTLPYTTIDDIYFINANDGFAINRYSRYITTDGGNSWTEQIENPGFSCKSISFKDDSIGYIVGAGGTVIKSKDGGANWQYIVGTNSFIYDIGCSSNKCFAVGSGGLLSSTDFGESWIEDSLTISGSVVNFINDSTGFIGGRFLLRTVDGGMIWDTISLGTNDTIWIRDVFFNDFNTGVFSGDKITNDFFGGQQTRPVVFKTIDAGLTWSKVLEDSISNMQGMQSIIFLNNGINGYIFSQLGSSLISSDGGNSWSLDSSSGINSVLETSKVNDSTGYVLTYGSIHKTANGGNTWNQVTSQSLSLTDIHFFSDSVGLATRGAGQIYKTNNGGVTWNLQFSLPYNSTGTTTFMSFINDTIGLAYGGNGIILKNVSQTTYFSSITTTICSGDSIFLQGNYQSVTGTFYDTLSSFSECDSVIATTLIVNQSTASSSFYIYPDTIPYNWYAVNTATGIPPLTYYWNWGDGDTSMGATPSHIYSDSGYYNICLTIVDSSGCSDTYCDSSTYINKQESATIFINVILPTSIAGQTELEKSISIYPNPSIGKFTISSNGSVNSIIVHNLMGEDIFKLPLQLFANSIIDLSNYPSGIYFIQIKSDEKIFNKKLILK